MKKLIDLEEFDIRYTNIQDELFLRKWLSYPGISHWFTIDGKLEIADMARIWVSFYRVKSSLTAVYKNKPCALATLFLMPYKKAAHMAMGYIIVNPEMQRKGIGSSLLKNLRHLAKNYFKLETIQFEVYGDNPLISCLKNRGYKEIYSQEKYVKEKNGTYLSRTLLEIDLSYDN